MRLEEYLQSRGLDPRARKDRKVFADEVGVNVESVTAWLKGKWHPNSNTQKRILKVTEGQVTAHDFY